MFTVALVTPQQSANYTINLLNYPFPSEIMKSTHSDNIVVIGGNDETSKTAPLNAFVLRSKRQDRRDVDSLSKVL